MARTVFATDRPVLPRHLNFMQETLLAALRQLRLALGTGEIFYGLEVYPAAGNAVRVLPGLAFDGNGNPLVIHQPLRVPVPALVNQTRMLALRYQPIVEERTTSGEVVLENDGAELVWVTEIPPDDTIVPLARVRPDGNGRILVESDVARRAARGGHRHSAELIADRSGRLRYDGDVVALESVRPTVSPADLNIALASLRRELFERLEALEQAVYTQRPETAPVSDVQGPGWEPELELIDGIGKNYAQQLAEVGVRTVPQLLEQAHTLPGRQQLSRATGISTTRLEAWVRFGDLMRLHGVTPEHARLLLDAGFNSVSDLAALEPGVVYDHIRGVFDPEQHQLRRLPRPALVRAWVNEARRLPPLPLE